MDAMLQIFLPRFFLSLLHRFLTYREKKRTVQKAVTLGIQYWLTSFLPSFESLLLPSKEALFNLSQRKKLKHFSHLVLIKWVASVTTTSSATEDTWTPSTTVAQAWVTRGIAKSTSIASLTKKPKTPQQPTFKIDTSKMSAKLEKMAQNSNT